MFVGDHYECRVKLGEDSVLLNVRRTMNLREGQQVRLELPDSGVSIWGA